MSSDIFKKHDKLISGSSFQKARNKAFISKIENQQQGNFESTVHAPKTSQQLTGPQPKRTQLPKSK